jgi:hypothetical protein
VKSKAHSIQLALLLAFFILLALRYTFWIPAGEGVDEVAHFKYVTYLKQERRLPIQPTNSAEPIVVWMGHHPPLYYALSAFALMGQDTSQVNDLFIANSHFKWVENNGRNGWNVMVHAGQDEFPGAGTVNSFFTVRFLGILLSTVTLFSLFQATKIAIPTVKWAPLLTTSMIAFNPSFVFMSVTIHHDVLQATLFSLGMWWMAHTIQNHDSKKVVKTANRPWLIGIIVGCAILTKISGLVLGLGVAITISILAIQKKDWRLFLHDGAISGGIAVLLSGGWFLRSWSLYGDLLGWSAYSHVFHFNLRSTPSWYHGTVEFFSQASRNFWGGFGFMHITFPEINRIFWIITIAMLVGWIVLAIREIGFFKKHSVVLAGSFSLLFGLLFVYLQFSSVNVGAGHGRYLFPANLAIGLIPTIGVYGFFGDKGGKYLAGLMSAAFLAYAIWLPMTQIVPKYAPPTYLERLPASAQATDLQLSSGIKLVGFEIIESRPLTPGTVLQTNLYWQIDGDSSEISDPYLELSLETTQSEYISASQSWPTPSIPPAYWPRDKIVQTKNSLYVPNTELPSTVWLKARNTVEPASEPILITELQTVGGATEIELNLLLNDLDVLFGNELRLHRYEFSKSRLTTNESLVVTVFWGVEKQPTADHTLFVHVIDQSGQVVTQLDRPTGGLQSPTSTWVEGQAWRDSYPIVLPPELADGLYSVRVGLYDWPSLERLAIQDSSETSFKLGEIEILSNR